MNDPAFAYDVFLSHSSKDEAVVRASSLSASNGERAGVRCRSLPLAGRLREAGLRLWFDEWEIKPGDSIPAKIEEGLEHSRVLACPAVATARRWMLCMSANAFGSDWAQLPQSHSQQSTFNPQRTSAPLNQERRFIPLRLDDAPIKGSLAQFLYINWRRRTASNSVQRARCCEALQQITTCCQLGNAYNRASAVAAVATPRSHAILEPENSIQETTATTYAHQELCAIRNWPV